jgi:hypothetical protein
MAITTVAKQNNHDAKLERPEWLSKGEAEGKAMKLSDWKLVGQMQAFYIRLHGLAVETFRAEKIGPEVLEWLDGPGNEFFGLKLVELAAEYKRQTTPILRAEIDLDADPTLPFNGTIVKKHLKEGKVVIEKRADGGAYVNSKKLALRRSNRQLNDESIRGTELCVEIEGQQWAVHNATLLDFFKANPQFWPDEWKRDEAGNTIYIFFWGSEFLRPANGGVCIRFGYWEGDAVVSNCNGLGFHWNANYPAVVSESNKYTLLG